MTITTILETLTTGFQAAEAAIVASVSSFFGTELLKLATEALTQIKTALDHFLAALKSGTTWGASMASMLTEVWNDTQSDLQQLATDFVEAVGKVFQNVGLLATA